MALSDDRSQSSDSSPFKFPSFLPKLFPFLQPKSLAADDANVSKPTAVSTDEYPQDSTPTVVSFPIKPPPKDLEPLNFEAEPSSGRTTNSLILWQVYALGGFLVLKWAWARWNERNERSDKKETKDEDEDDEQTSGGHED